MIGKSVHRKLTKLLFSVLNNASAAVGFAKKISFQIVFKNEVLSLNSHKITLLLFIPLNKHCS